jgi:hypothetical protein
MFVPEVKREIAEQATGEDPSLVLHRCVCRREKGRNVASNVE